MTETLETLAGLSLLVFVIGSMASMGLSLKMPQIIAPLKNLRLVSSKKSLSFREKKMYEGARYFIVSEVANVKNITEEEAEKKVDKFLESSIEKRAEMQGKGIGFRVAMRPGKRKALPDTLEGRLDDLVETAKAHIRAKGEHPFRVIKRQFGFTKVTIADRRGTIAHGTRCSRYATCTYNAACWRLRRTSVSAFLYVGRKPGL